MEQGYTGLATQDRVLDHRGTKTIKDILIHSKLVTIYNEVNNDNIPCTANPDRLQKLKIPQLLGF